MPGFKNCFVVDVAPQLGMRQTRLLEGEYVVTKDDVMERVHFPDTVARGRDYYTPYRVDAAEGGRGPDRRRPALLGDRSRAENVARDPALHVDGPVGRRRRRARARPATSPLRRVEPRAICAQVRAQGGDPGDRPSANAKMMEHAA